MNKNDIFEQRKQFFIEPSSTVKGAVLVCLVLGLITLGYGFVAGNKLQVWGSILFNVFFFFALGLGGVAFSAMQDVIGAEWGRPIKRLHEGFGAFLPVGAAVFILFLLAVAFNVGEAGSVYSWVKDPAEIQQYWGKNFWLSKNFMVTRNILGILGIVALSFWQYKKVLGRDMLMLNGNQAEAERVGRESQEKLRYWSAPVLVGYALLFSMMSFDLLMSLSPTWLSTLFGGWTFSITMQTLMATILIFMFALRNTTIGQVYGRQQFHDVGKMMHGFTVFFAYLTYAHILTYWYGNMPEETEYFIHRLHAPWIYIVMAIPLFAFLIPLYAMIPKASKWTAPVTIPLAVLILVAQWYMYLIIVMPEVVDGANWHFPTIEGGIFLLFLGLFLASYFFFAKRYPMISIADPLLPNALKGDHH